MKEFRVTFDFNVLADCKTAAEVRELLETDRDMIEAVVATLFECGVQACKLNKSTVSYAASKALQEPHRAPQEP